MLSSDEIIRTVEMLKSENLDVRTVTLGVSLRDCAGASAQGVCDRIREKMWGKRRSSEVFSGRRTSSR